MPIPEAFEAERRINRGLDIAMFLLNQVVPKRRPSNSPSMSIGLLFARLRSSKPERNPPAPPICIGTDFRPCGLVAKPLLLQMCSLVTVHMTRYIYRAPRSAGPH
jgi:hypothetical protein